jgi:hypothetical protein
MPTTVPADIPTWYIVLEFLKFIFSPAFLVTVAGVLLLVVYFWTYHIHPIGLRCNATYSRLIDTTTALLEVTAKDIEDGKLTDEQIKEFIHSTVLTMYAIRTAKDQGQQSRMSIVVKDALVGLIKRLKDKAQARS